MKNILLLLLIQIFCVHLQAQFLESFDTEIPSNWTVIDNDGQGGSWQFHAGSPYQGTGGVRINHESEPHDDYLISPQFSVIEGISDLVSFFAGGMGQTYPESFDIKLSTTGNQVGDFTITLGSVYTIADINTDGYVNYTYNLTPYVGSEVYIAIVATSPPAFRLLVDEFSVEALPDCPKPTNFSPTTITPNSATLDWDSENNETNWEIKYGNSNFDPTTSGTSILVENESSVLIEELESGTKYYVYIKSFCDENGESQYTGPLIFSTECAPATLPFYESFENQQVDGSYLGGCWTHESILGGSWIANNSITTQNRAPRTGEWDVYLSYGNEAWMFYEIELTEGTHYTVSLYARQSNVAGANIKVAYGISNQSGEMLNEIIPETEITDGDYQLVTGNFTAETSGTFYIGIFGHLNGGFFPFFMTVDDVSIQELILCPMPTDLTFESATPNSTTVSWTPGDAETEWLVKYGDPGFNPENEGTAISISDSPIITIPDLEDAHRYNVFVQAICGDENGNSNFAGPISVAATPINDDLCNALPLIIDEVCSGSTYSNVGATLENSEPFGNCFDAPGDKTVWFSFVAPESGNVTVTTDFEGGTLLDTEVAVFGAPSDCTDFTTLGNQLGCDEDGGEIGDGFLSVVTLTDLAPGETYYIQVVGFIDFWDGATEGTFCLEVQDDGFSCPAPSNIIISNVGTTSAQVDWTPGEEETNWEIAFGNPDFDPNTEGTIFTDDDGVAGTTLFNLLPDTTYEVYVRAICDTDDLSLWTGPELFTTENLSIDEIEFVNFNFYPNPFDNQIKFESEYPIEKIQIHTMTGQKIIEVFPKHKNFSLSTASLQTGTYLLTVTINSRSKGFKVLKN